MNLDRHRCKLQLDWLARGKMVILLNPFFYFLAQEKWFRTRAITLPIMVDSGLYLVAKGNWTTIIALKHQLDP